MSKHTQQLSEGAGLLVGETLEAVVLLDQVLSRLLVHGAAARQEPGEDRTPIGGVRDPLDQSIALETVDTARDRGRVNREVVRKLVQQQLIVLSEIQLSKDGVARERDAVGPEDRVQSSCEQES